MTYLDENQTEGLLKAVEHCIEPLDHAHLNKGMAIWVLSQYFEFPTKYKLMALDASEQVK